VRAAAFSPDDKILALGLNTGRVLFWDVALQQAISSDPKAPELFINAIGFAAQGAMVTAGDSDAWLWQLSSRRQSNRAFVNQGDVIKQIAFGAADTLVCLLANGEVDWWDIASGERLAVLHSAGTTSGQFGMSPDSRVVAVADRR